MQRLFSFAALFPVFAGLLIAQYKSEPAGAPPSDIAPSIASTLSADGVKVSKADGSAVMEIWLRKAPPTGGKNAGDAIAFANIPVGALLGVVKFWSKGADRRGQPLQPGIYTLRYVLMPTNGDHLGAAPQRDFVVLIPAADDKDPAATPDLETLVKMSIKASGTPHPAVLSIASGSGTAGFTKEGEHDWTLNGKLGDLPVAIILLGRAES